jgi:hypothetical protein
MSVISAEFAASGRQASTVRARDTLRWNWPLMAALGLNLLIWYAIVQVAARLT